MQFCLLPEMEQEMMKGDMCCEVKKKNVDRNDAQGFRVACLPAWEYSPFSVLSPVVLLFALQK